MPWQAKPHTARDLDVPHPCFETTPLGIQSPACCFLLCKESWSSPFRLQNLLGHCTLVSTSLPLSCHGVNEWMQLPAGGPRIYSWTWACVPTWLSACNRTSDPTAGKLAELTTPLICRKLSYYTYFSFNPHSNCVREHGGGGVGSGGDLPRDTQQQVAKTGWEAKCSDYEPVKLASPFLAGS